MFFNFNCTRKCQEDCIIRICWQHWSDIWKIWTSTFCNDNSVHCDLVLLVFYEWSWNLLKFVEKRILSRSVCFYCRNNENFLQKLHTLHTSHTSLCYPPPKMPSSDPLPPKESAIFRKILVSLSLYIGPHFRRLMSLIVISRIMTTKNMRLINKWNNLFQLHGPLSLTNIYRSLHFRNQFNSWQSDNRLPGFFYSRHFFYICEFIVNITSIRFLS